MNNFERLLPKNIKEMASIIEKYLEIPEICDYCVYDIEKCSTEDCE